MKAIILAAGDGSRMGGLTKNLPKPLIDVNGRSIIEHQLHHLRKLLLNIRRINSLHRHSFKLQIFI